MNKLFPVYLLLLIITVSTMFTRCANIIPPGGGPIDSFPPMLVSAIPKDSVTNFTGNRIILNFNEYVDLQNAFENVIVSPLPKNLPVISNNFRSVNVKIKDTLEPNTTYSINFGNAIRDINEGNVLKNFTYIFSTGSTIDQNAVSGKVIIAETGKVDSTLIVVLHRNLADSAVTNEKPRYLTKLDGNGNFEFRNLAAGNFAIYALPNDYSRRYDDTTKLFAFADSSVNTVSNSPITLLAYAHPKRDTTKNTNTNNDTKGAKGDAPLRLVTNLQAGRQDLLTNFEVGFTKKVRSFDTAKFRLTDTNYNPIKNYSIVVDTTNNRFIFKNNWAPSTPLVLLTDKTAVADSAGVTLLKSDTLRFITKKFEDYGSVKIRFANLDLTKNPVLQLVQNGKIVESIPMTQREWSRKLFVPGEYDIRILFDANKNGVWDPGRFYGEHRQPETAITLKTNLSVKANWDNEKDITL